MNGMRMTSTLREERTKVFYHNEAVFNIENGTLYDYSPGKWMRQFYGLVDDYLRSRWDKNRRIAYFGADERAA
jgi:hypothetical protein